MIAMSVAKSPFSGMGALEKILERSVKVLLLEGLKHLVVSGESLPACVVCLKPLQIILTQIKPTFCRA